jgi:DNA polymerase V
MYALVDCNNFYVSCEQVFNPRLRNKPVVVLSSNDGCVISRSKEAKQIGIPMGVPAFQCEKLFKQYGVILLSSNFSLYGDMSERVMQTLSTFDIPVSIYSIDEAFLKFPHLVSQLDGQRIREKVLQWTGISTCVGIGPTKTLAKVANGLAKKTSSSNGVYMLSENLDPLDQLAIDEVWGIGRQTSVFLKGQGIFYARQLADQSDTWVKTHLSVTGLRTAMELRGVPCIPFEEERSAKKGITTSRSFGQSTANYQDISEAVATFIAIAAQKLRKQACVTSFLTISLVTKNFQRSSAYVHLDHPTAETALFIEQGLKALKTLYKQDVLYRKAGVTLYDLYPATAIQPDMFASKIKPSIMPTMDAINAKKGPHTLFFGAEGIKARWKPLADKKSQSFTTKWTDLLKVKV